MSNTIKLNPTVSSHEAQMLAKDYAQYIVVTSETTIKRLLDTQAEIGVVMVSPDILNYELERILAQR